MYRKDGLIATYLKLKALKESNGAYPLLENGSPSDFPNVMADVQHKILLNAFRGFPSVWNLAAKITEVPDFKPNHRKWLSEMDGLKPKAPGGPYQAFTMFDRGYNVLVETFGGTFSLLRETVINDDLDAFRDVPTKMGRAAARSLAKEFVRVIEANELAYDGSALIRAGNSSSTALTADATGIAALQTATAAIATATDPDSSEIMGLQAKYLMVSPALAETAKWLLTSTAMVGGNTTNGLQANPLLSPALNAPLQLIVEPMLQRNFPNRWYVLADPEQCHAVEVAFLNGNREPELFLKSSNALSLGGGSLDRFGYEYDDIEYKIRWDYDVKAAFYQAIYKGGS